MFVMYNYFIKSNGGVCVCWWASEARETLSGVYKFEICDKYRYNTCIWIYRYVRHYSSAGKY